MSSYGFSKKAEDKPSDDTILDLSGITRTPLAVDPVREAAAMERGTALGFVDRSQRTAEPDTPIRRRRQTTPQSSVYIKGPRETLDWFIEYTNEREHRSYWQTLEEFRVLVEASEARVETVDPKLRDT